VDWANELKKRFGGFWNAIFLIAVLVICLRFAGAEWKAEELGTRLLYALYLVLIVAAVGIVVALAKLLLTKFNPPRYSSASTVSADVAWGLKYGIASGTLIVFTIGVLMVDDYLGPVKTLFDLVKDIVMKKFFP
jgi:hypothetical protein